MQTSQTVPDVAQWMEERARKDDRLYERHGRDLEADHDGEFVAISDDGRLIVGPDELSVSDEAARRIGAGSFALRRIGADAEIRWRELPA